MDLVSSNGIHLATSNSILPIGVTVIIRVTKGNQLLILFVKKLGWQDNKINGLNPPFTNVEFVYVHTNVAYKIHGVLRCWLI